MSAIAPNYKRTKLGCYASYFTMSSIFCLPPMLFVTFHETFHISYTLLGTLILVNFFTQLGIDLIFTLFSKHFPIAKVIRIMPLITAVGMALYALIPWLFPQIAYIGLLIGTVIFSVSAGLSEVLLSPVIAAIPSKNPQRDMSLLHSLYAFGVFTMVTISTLFLKVFGTENWMYLTLLLAALPMIPAVLFMTSPIPDMNAQEGSGAQSGAKRRIFALAICAACIFFGSCAENAMSNWISSYMEKSLRIDKAIGDILGVAMFAILLGIARISYAKFGKNIFRVLFVGMVGAAVCYLIAGLSDVVPLSFAACIFTGLFTAMLWPGTLIMMEDNVPGAGVAAFALMAASGDLGASVAPQLLGIVTDTVAAANGGAEQLGMKAGMLVCAAFPILGILAVTIAIIYFRKNKIGK